MLPVRENIRLIQELAELRDEAGALRHPRLGQVGIVDGTRRYAPIPQRWLASAEHLAVLRRPGMEMVSPSRYDHGDQHDDVIGWRVHSILDQATSLPLVWVITPAAGKKPDAERTVLTERPLPMLFSLWPECPMHTLIGDVGYDSDDVCWELETAGRSTRCSQDRRQEVDRSSESASPTSRQRTESPTARNAVNRCSTGSTKASMTSRREDGLARGQLAPPHRGKTARVRWRCPKRACSQTVDAADGRRVARR